MVRIVHARIRIRYLVQRNLNESFLLGDADGAIPSSPVTRVLFNPARGRVQREEYEAEVWEGNRFTTVRYQDVRIARVGMDKPAAQ